MLEAERREEEACEGGRPGPEARARLLWCELDELTLTLTLALAQTLILTRCELEELTLTLTLALALTLILTRCELEELVYGAVGAYAPALRGLETELAAQAAVKAQSFGLLLLRSTASGREVRELVRVRVRARVRVSLT